MSKLPAIFYAPAGYDTGGAKLMGRHVANAGLLKAFARSAGTDPVPCYVKSAADGEDFDRMIRRAAPAATTTTILAHELASLGGPGCVFVPDPGIRDIARLRLSVGWRHFSVCGVTHTTASRWAMESIADLVLEPYAPWDALICTSRAVRDTVRVLVEERRDYLQWRLGAVRPWLPQLPVIPLGVDCDEMHQEQADREVARQSLGIRDDEVVFLFVGRLSFHAKANPLPMLRALGVAAAGRKLRLIQCGWFATEGTRRLFEEATAALCPDVPVAYLDGRDADTRRTAWAAADVFTSLVDNIQETFGLTPIEAMAAGLPCVVSDWDGYRETVRHGVDGLRVRTLAAPPGTGQSIADAFADGRLRYDNYCGFASQFAAVDIDETIAAYSRLADDADLRRRLGASGRRHARARYDWAVIARQYLELWDDLAERRRADPDPEPRPAPRRHAAQLDPMRLFKSYPTRALGPDDAVALRPGESVATYRALAKLTLVDSGRSFGPTDAEVEALIAALADGKAKRARTVVETFPEPRRLSIMRGLVWLAKLGIVRSAPRR